MLALIGQHYAALVVGAMGVFAFSLLAVSLHDAFGSPRDTGR